MKFKNFALLFNLNLKFLGKLLNLTVFLILTFDDSFNWSKQLMMSDNNELPISNINGFTFGLELLRTILWMWRLSAFISIYLDSYNGISFLIRRFE